MASSSANHALVQLPVRPCRGSGKGERLEANYTELEIPKLVVHRYAITIVQLNKGKVEQAGHQVVQKQKGPGTAAPPKSDVPDPGKPATSVKQNAQQTGQPATGKQKSAIATPAIPPNNPWNAATPVKQNAQQAGQPATGKQKAAVIIPAIPLIKPWKAATPHWKTSTTTPANNAATLAGTPSRATTSAPVGKPDLSAAIALRPANSGAASSSDAAAVTPETKDEQKKDGPTGKKAEQIIKLFLHLPALREFKKHIFTDFRALLFSTQDLPLIALSQVVKYRAENNDTATQNALEYLVKLDHTAHFDIGRLTAGPGPRNPQLDVVAKQDMMQALNILFLHYGRSSPSRLSVGSRRSFPSTDPPSGESSMEIGDGILAMRGYFSSVHVVDYRILVNVNVSHGSFYQAGSLLDLMVQIDRDFRHRPGGLFSILRGIRIGQKHFTDSSGKPLPPQKRTKTIVGFATEADGQFPTGKEPANYHQPRVPRPFAGPEEVHFWYEERAASSGSRDAKGLKATGSKGKPPQGASARQGGYYISVSDYFRNAYPRWPRLDRELPVVNVGSVQQPTYLPVEVCHVMFGQPYKKRLTANQTTTMIDFAVRDSNVTHQDIIQNGFKAVGLVAEDNPQISLLNIQAKTQMIKVRGRTLMAPQLVYSQANSAGIRKVHSKAGKWDLRDVNFRRAQALPEWSWLCIVDKQSTKRLVPVEQAFGKFQESLKETGMELGGPNDPDYMELEDASETKLQQWIYSCRHKYKLDVIVIMLPYKDTHMYNLIKRIGDVDVGIHTICVVRERFCKWDKYDNKQTFANIALKANLKLQGLNHELSRGFLGIIEEGKTMVVGIDVTHPSPGSESGCPSVAAMVASIDEKLGQWPAALSLQYRPRETSDPRQPWEKKLDPRQEMVSEIGLMLGSRLDLWCKKHSDVAPENILIYRDGVSEGQYEAVLEMELKRMQAYCANYYFKRNQYPPRFTLIVVAKRHHTRFFAPDIDKKTGLPNINKKTNLPNIDKKTGLPNKVNPVNGTVVDTGVTDDQTWDFFLQSHTAVQGTARPAHYIVLLNQIFGNIRDGPKYCMNTADVVERITHNMCYMYSRATKAVSYCPAAYYADRACERGRVYLSRFFNRNPTLEGPPELATDDDIKVKEPLTDAMFYI